MSVDRRVPKDGRESYVARIHRDGKRITLGTFGTRAEAEERRQDGLGAGEGLAVDQVLVAALVFHARVADGTDVVGVASSAASCEREIALAVPSRRPRRTIEAQSPRNRNALALAQRPHARIGRRGEVGLCWLIVHRRGRPRILWHNGGTWGFRSFAAFAPEKAVAVVVLSSSTCSVDRVGFQLLDTGL